MATKKAIKHYAVDVQRVSYSHFLTISVVATSPEEAVRKAMDKAGNYEYREDSAEYVVDETREVKLP